MKEIVCNICYDIIHIHYDVIHRCSNKCNSQYHKLCAKKWATKTNTCPFCRSDNFFELPDLSKFFKYCEEGKLEEIKKLNLSLEDIRSDNNYALILASSNGNLNLVKYLCEFTDQNNNRLNIDDIRSWDNYAFRWASEKGHLEVVKYLCEFTDQNNNRLDIKDIRSFGWDYKPNFALRYASINGHLPVVKYLCEFTDQNNNRLNIDDIRSGNNEALTRSTYYGHLDVVKYLCEFTDQHNNRLDINDITSKRCISKDMILVDDNNVLREASLNGHTKIVCYLKEKFNLI